MKKVIIVIVMLVILTACKTTKIQDTPVTSSSNQSSTDNSIVESFVSNNLQPQDNKTYENNTIQIVKPKIEFISPKKITSISKEHDLYKFSNDNIYTVSDNNKHILYENGNEINDYIFNLGYAPDLVIDNLYFSLKGVLDENGKMNIELIVYDLKNKTSKSVYSEPLTNYRNYLYQLNESEVMFSYNGIKNDNRCEYVVIYNFIDNKCRIVYEHYEYDWDDKSTTSQEITATSANNNKIYLIKEQRINNEINYFLTCIDKNGKLIYEDKLDYLKEYTQKEGNIDYVNVCNNYVFTAFFNVDYEKINCAIGKKVDNKYIKVDLNSNIQPAQRESSSLIDNRYIIFPTLPDDIDFNANIYSADLIVFDILEDNYRLLKYDIEGVGNDIEFNTFINEKGDLLTFYIDYNSGERFYYLLSYEDWI